MCDEGDVSCFTPRVLSELGRAVLVLETHLDFLMQCPLLAFQNPSIDRYRGEPRVMLTTQCSVGVVA